jgi:hypothetical protein
MDETIINKWVTKQKNTATLKKGLFKQIKSI